MNYINDPRINRLTAPENRLYRPNINFKKAIIITMSVLSFTIIASVILTTAVIVWSNWYGHLFEDRLVLFLKICAGALLFTMFFSFKHVLIWLVRVYQRYARSETRLKCCFIPSCSEYAVLAIQKYGAFVGSIMAVFRLLRCTPPGGTDYP